MRMDMTPVLILLVIFGSIVAIIRAVTEHRVKLKYLERGPEGVPSKPLDLNLGNGIGGSLKWGLVCVFMGGALLIMEMMPRYFEDEAILGGMFLAAGVALLLYYFIADQKKKRSHQM